MAEINFNQKVACKSCTEDIFSVHTVLLRCSVCPDLDLCPDCFAAGVHLGDHAPAHSYKVVDNGGFALLGSGWSAREHIRLLDSVEQYGFGNWEDIARQISQNNTGGTVRTPEETRIEFSNVFINGTLGRHTWHEDARGRSRDHTQGNPLLPPSQPAEPPANLTNTEAIMLGYMPKRDDFEVEYDNEAECLVSQIHSNASNGSEDEDVDLALKAAHVDMYKFKLRERERRKKVARDHALISQFFKENPVTASERRSAFGLKTKKKDTRVDLTERLKVLAEFQGVAEHQAFMASILKEKDLKNRVKDLLRFRKNGICQLKDSTDYEIQRLRRIKRRNELRKKFDIIGFNDSASPMAFRDELSYAGSPVGSALSPSKSLTDDKLNSIIGLPGFEVLSLNERKLCSNLRLTPAHYISYKTCLLTNHLQKKKGQTPKPLNPDGLDKNNRKIILQFLIRSGWITAY